MYNLIVYDIVSCIVYNVMSHHITCYYITYYVLRILLSIIVYYAISYQAAPSARGVTRAGAAPPAPSYSHSGPTY